MHRIHQGKFQSPPQRGFSLIEVMVSIVLVSIGMVGLLGLLASTIKTGNNSQDRNRAAMVVNELVTDMWLNASTDTSSGSLLTDLNFLNAAIQNPNLPSFYVAPNAQLNVARAGTTATITLSWTPANHVAAQSANTYTTYGQDNPINYYTTQVTAP